MNIIEAIQKAENGALITNNFMKLNNRFLKYIKGGVFYEYELIEDKPLYKFEVLNFTMSEVISIGWEILPTNYFSAVGGN